MKSGDIVMLSTAKGSNNFGCKTNNATQKGDILAGLEEFGIENHRVGNTGVVAIIKNGGHARRH